ncbi:QcrA and Rieske domain-containing protein [Mucilaginibacter gilvus]|uniref:Rieske (2Fe-2S) protein n=1 Tax=Mucilaginibacter gilvus TaxID=2305909 RepID=A0A444MST2_9SPHI|nr:Rieske 2Fe-2S domain-containing protein [Mucilaginibacter gilvus]RWY55679.1 Rieske (2Fe-2S) protein [Mucilaginibacter gilvus]
MERHEFLAKLGIGLAAVCTGCSLVSCGSNPKNEDPTPTADGNIFTTNLDAELLNVGDAKVSNGVILARTAAGNAAASFSAVQVACTHEGTFINYNPTAGIYICPLHGSRFSKEGFVLQGPAASSLKKYNVIITGTSLAVRA